MMQITYSRNGIPVSDFVVEQFVLYHDNRERAEPGRQLRLSVSSELVVEAARVLWKERKLLNRPEFVFEGDTYIPDDDGRIKDWPDGFCNTGLGLLQRLL